MSPGTVSASELANLIPHEPPMLWIDEVVHYTEDEILCRVTLHEGHVFIDDGQAESIVVVELLAQSVAALVGLSDRARGLRPRPGYLAAIPEATFYVPIVRVGQTLDLACSRSFGQAHVASFDCIARHAGNPVARAVINVVRPDKLP
jgi:predicted hotdog family 3-hydroxylacyl-ACP dehydratase